MTASTPVDIAPRGRKDLESTAAATAYQKAFGAELRERVVERGEPFALAQADTPHEIFHAMDIPVVSNQWWSAYISAKRLSGLIPGKDIWYPSNRCRYCSLGPPVHWRTIRRSRHGVGSRSPPCSWRDSPATASSRCSRNGPRSCRPSSSRWKRPRGNVHCPTGSATPAIAGTRSTSRSVSHCSRTKCARSWH